MNERKICAVPKHLDPVTTLNGFRIRPGLFLSNGASVIPGGVSFTIHSYHASACELLLFHRQEDTPFAVLPFPAGYRIGNTFSMIVFDLDITEFEYAYRMDGPYDPKQGLLFDRNNILLDPYARAVTGQSRWGTKPSESLSYRARVVADDFDWGDFSQPEIPFEDLVIYEMHVRGFTKDPSSKVSHPGTFDAIREKIPYLLELGVNAVELMPVFEFDEMQDMRVYDGKPLYNYWGYNPVCFFAPNTSYASAVEYNAEGTELKTLIKALHENGIEVILDVVFNHTAEGDQRGPVISLKGLDNNIYYLMTPDGSYYNFSGCGNTLNCSHPIVQQMILSCLRHWVVEYRVDGFRFDLASILGRDSDGSPLSKPPLLKNLAFDPILGKVKLIAEAWDAGGMYQVGSFPSWKRWAEWNGKYRDDLRQFLKGDGGKAQAAANRIIGSPDLYDPGLRGEDASVNFLTCHDGFTLYDLYAYGQKHNEANGWDNTDGDNNGNCWNCGAEGETGDPSILELRSRMRKNAFAVLMCSRSAVMFLAGDEFCNTQFGNNNPYCQDNPISWLDWNRLGDYKDMYAFCRQMISLRKSHPVLRRKTAPASCGFPDVSFHTCRPWQDSFDFDTRMIGILYAGRTDDDMQDDVLYLAVNAFWEDLILRLPDPPQGSVWRLETDTYDDTHTGLLSGTETLIHGRSVMIFLLKFL